MCAVSIGEDNHGPYELTSNAFWRGGYIIRRQDGDGHKRTVAFVDNPDQWKRFVAALESGAVEVAAVHAIDGGKL